MNNETKMVDRTEEKIALAKELGLKGYVQMKEEIKILTELKFKPITHEEIAKKIESFYVRFELNEFSLQVLFFSGLVFFLTTFFGTAYFDTTQAPDWPALKAFLGGLRLASFIAAIPLVVGLISLFVHRSRSKTMALSSWKEELPYGALLATKEAVAKGIKDLHIAYPVTATRHAEETRIKADPVIYGYIGNNMVEIFAWDDSKIYE